MIPESSLTKNPSILYVDDEQINLFLFEQNFKDNHPVFVANSGEEALEVLQDQKDQVVIVITDYMMPGMNGLEFVKKAQDQYNNIVYFMLTGFCEKEDVRKAVEEKTIYTCFSKPMNIELMELKIKEALENLA